MSIWRCADVNVRTPAGVFVYIIDSALFEIWSVLMEWAEHVKSLLVSPWLRRRMACLEKGVLDSAFTGLSTGLAG